MPVGLPKPLAFFVSASPSFFTKMPFEWNICTFRFFKSATAMCPSESIAIPAGQLNWPIQLPFSPNFAKNRPVSSNFCTREFPESETKILSSWSMAIWRGQLNFPSASPYTPKCMVAWPSESKMCIRWLSRSATMTRPSESRARPHGPFSCPRPLPLEPNFRRNCPSWVNTYREQNNKMIPKSQATGFIAIYVKLDVKHMISVVSKKTIEIYSLDVFLTWILWLPWSAT